MRFQSGVNATTSKPDKLELKQQTNTDRCESALSKLDSCHTWRLNAIIMGDPVPCAAVCAMLYAHRKSSLLIDFPRLHFYSSLKQKNSNRESCVITPNLETFPALDRRQSIARIYVYRKYMCNSFRLLEESPLDTLSCMRWRLYEYLSHLSLSPLRAYILVRNSPVCWQIMGTAPLNYGAVILDAPCNRSRFIIGVWTRDCDVVVTARKSRKQKDGNSCVDIRVNLR